MKNEIRLLVIFLASIAMFSCQDKQKKTTINTTDELLTAYFQSIGGYDNIKAIDTKIIDGHYIEPGYNLLLKAHQEFKRPYYRVVGDNARGFAEGFDGKSWEYNKKKGYYRSEGEAEKATLRGAEFDESYIDYKEKGYEVEFKGITTLENQEYYELLLKYPEGDVKRYFFDKSNYLPRYMTKTMPLHAVGKPIDYIVSITDYRKVGNVLFPFSKIERNVHTGKMINSTLTDTIVLNEDIPLSWFSPIK